MNSNFLSTAMTIKDIRKTEMVLPIARKTTVVTAFLLGDHGILKTAILSPQNYDREITKCLHRRCTIIDVEGNEVKYKYDELVSQISNIDKVCLIWACYKSTYKELGQREVICSKCGIKNNYKISLEELIQEDSITFWEDETTPFYNYTYTIEVPYDDGYSYQFDTQIPTIKKYNQVLGSITIEKIKENLETNTVLSSSEELAVMVNSIKIKKGDSIVTETNKLQEILIFLSSALPTEVSEYLKSDYEKKFDKYQPKFYTNLKCSCGNSQKYMVDIETEFFRRTLFGRESNQSEL